MEVVIYISAVFFTLLIFPVYVFNYVYVDTDEKYVSINVSLFKILNLLNVNTVKDKMGKIDINGKEKAVEFNGSFLKSLKYAYNRIYIKKVIQLADFGVKKQSNSYAALGQNAITQVVYSLFKKSPNVKLKNHVIFNDTHGNIRYYLKIVTVINLLVVLRILLCYLTEK
ncbi:MAG: hypothetical protein J6B04_05830, partial [Clostridia bacterium]|nr:hypothetical protein [Clostridia bacterium]